MAIPWHRIFGMALTQYFAGSAWKVDVEVDLSLQQQRLDLVVLRHTIGLPEPEWPDGFGPPAEYNLLTFKALQDPLNAWTLKELAAHSVSFRKYVSLGHAQLAPEDRFRLLAASMRFPRQLAGRFDLQPKSPGAYDVVWGMDTIRILVLREMPETQQNLVWNLFSGDQGCIASAFQRLQPRIADWSSILNDLLQFYGLEGMQMPYTMEQYEHDAAQRLLKKLSLEQRLEGIPPEQRLEGIPPEQRLQGLTPEQRVQGLSPEQRLQGLPVEQLLEILPLHAIEQYLKKRKATENNH